MSKTPVVLFIFKRSETLWRIIGQIKKYNPNKMYVIADGGRTEEEKALAEKTREIALSLIDWDCEVVTDFSDENVGVYNRIGEGAKWVLSQEEKAIFLEDDNYPEDTFFQYCDDLLERYSDDNDVGWICGTNYLGDSSELGPESYYYTYHLLPCGWASWKHKFNGFYDGELETLDPQSISVMKSTYADKRLFLQELQSVKQTKFNYLRNPKIVSWDRQMCFSIRSTKKFGIAPHKNQIKNIGVDVHSEHGGTSMNIEMTSRFCEIPTFQLQFPLVAPMNKVVNNSFENRNSDIILYPFIGRV
ncbi:glycosyltransferase family A protein, partial [Shewanella sp. GutDb-MelDb]|uniref:glycosyltransferase family A protein n=1 Tax=Shewanella sp. GutDb-MelDb TaxID=2058316 RepID=UPI000C7D2B16